MKTAISTTLAVLKWAGIAIGLLIALIAIASIVVPPLTRSFTDRWGATDAEAVETLSGDSWVMDAQQSATRAITIDAPADLVLQLVRQQGYKRAGWHGWDWFYQNTGSAEFIDGHFSTRVVPELQGITVGDKVFINSAVSYVVEQDSPPTPDGPGVFAMYSGGDASGASLRAKDSEKATAASTSWVWVAKSLGPRRLVSSCGSVATCAGRVSSWRGCSTTRSTSAGRSSPTRRCAASSRRRRPWPQRTRARPLGAT
jgi:hypothetical protein